MTAAPKPCSCPAPTRRSVLATAGATAFLVPAAGLVAPAPARAGFAEQPATPQDEAFMRRTIDLAKANDKRFAAIIVSDGEVIVEGINEVRGADGRRDPTAHGEMIAIRTCVATRGAGALVGATLYTTGEPCPMCMGAIVWCRISRFDRNDPAVRSQVR